MLKRKLAQWWRNRRMQHIGAELEHLWEQRRSLEVHERRLMREHQNLISADINAQIPTCRGRHGY